MKTVTENTAKTLRQLRTKAGITQDQLAAAIGIKTCQTISNIEGMRAPFPRHLIAGVAKKLKVDPSVFINTMTKDFKISLERSITTSTRRK